MRARKIDGEINSHLVDRDLQVNHAVFFRCGKIPRPHIHLNRRQQQRRHAQPGITLGAHLDERRLINTVMHMNIVFALLADGGLVLRLPTSGG